MSENLRTNALSLFYTDRHTGNALLKKLLKFAKRYKYRVLGQQHRFEPLAFETSGVFGPSTLRTIKEIGRRMAAPWTP
jgi:hypothetical protein